MYVSMRMYTYMYMSMHVSRDRGHRALELCNGVPSRRLHAWSPGLIQGRAEDSAVAPRPLAAGSGFLTDRFSLWAPLIV